MHRQYFGRVFQGDIMKLLNSRTMLAVVGQVLVLAVTLAAAPKAYSDECVQAPGIPKPVCGAEWTNPGVFDPGYYLRANPDLMAAFGAEPNAFVLATSHWIRSGIVEGRSASAAFSAQEYLAMYSDISGAFGPTNYALALKHFVDNGKAEGRAGRTVLRGEVFDVGFYLRAYPDLQAAFGGDVNAATQHWLNNGLYEGRTGSPSFSAVSYLSRYGDLSNAFGANYAAAIQHYIFSGQYEGRSGTP
jgi:serralysin